MTTLGSVLSNDEPATLLRESERQFRDLFEHGPVAYHELDRQGIVRRVNQAECALLGLQAEDMLGKPIFNFIAPGDLSQSCEAFEWKLSEKQPIAPFLRRYLRSDGRELTLEIYDALIHSETGAVTGIRSALLDVTSRTKAEEEAREREETLQTVCISSIDAIVMIDGAGRVVLWNPAAERMFGYSAAEMLGKPVHDLLAPADLQGHFRAAFPAFQRTGQGAAVNKIMEMTALRRDGKEIPIELALAAVRKRNEWYAVGTIRDISERKRAEEAMLQQTARLLSSNRELEQFAYVASHDLQEPLRMVASYTELLARRYKGKLDNDADDFIAFAVDGATRMQRLISDLLAYSRVTTKGREPELVDTRTAFDQAVNNLNAAMREANAIVTSGFLPKVMADSGQLVQLFQNLVGNAVKFHGDDPPRVHVSAEYRDKEWVFSIRDNGIGVESQHLDRIFVIFQRLHGRAEYPGTGIGLAICKRIVERHGGRIWASSVPGEGATFYFTIPVRDL